MARNPVTFINGTLVQKAQVEIDGTTYDVEPAQYDGTTPLSANNLNLLQTRLYDYVDEISTKTFPDGKYSVLTGQLTMADGEGTTNINYPTGFTKDNTIVISVMTGNNSNPVISYSYGTIPDVSGIATGSIYKRVSLGTNNMILGVYNHTASGNGTINYKILLIKI